MSDTPQEPANPSSPQPKSSGTGHKGLFIILIAIAVVLAAFCYETFLAPANLQAGFDKVAEAQLKSLGDKKTLTNLDVREVLGKEPADTYNEGEEYVEVFHWMGGMIVNSHKLYAVYRKQGEDWTFVRHSLKPKEMTDKQTIVVDPDAIGDDSESSMDTADGSGPPKEPNGEDDSSGADQPANDDNSESGSDSGIGPLEEVSPSA
ncbi:hypothetical protein [Rhodopirellula bahusiensis]|uniref:Uncharacterized protein n=1 Tax=Rhodopirellula bahusiensis TaxID=2014065 RepID=A0A2G1W4U9_9BACT|nr:hypothetical protein [Rhodopirellula bahusiensis]PHQ34068.1 hypothetical protein CEE69_17395 [Rhodopirellula bahusiensis]